MTNTPAAVAPLQAPAGTLPVTASPAIPALFAVLLGLSIVGVTGFSHIDAIHNATHNTRHANAFPCH